MASLLVSLCGIALTVGSLIGASTGSISVETAITIIVINIILMISQTAVELLVD